MNRSSIVPFFSLVLCLCSPALAGPQKKSASVDRLGLTCAQILQMPSADWVKKFTAAKAATLPPTLQAITPHGKCYDPRPSRLAAALAKSGKGPLMGARGNFRDFQHALDDFAA